MDTFLYNLSKKSLERIEKCNSKEDIKRIKILIGRYRVGALKSYGFIKSYLHKQANELEKALINATKNYDQTYKR